VSDNIDQDVVIHGKGNIVVGKGDVIINPLPPAEERLRRDLGILLRNVENTWIKGVLEKSVHEAALLELGMELREEVVDNPWRMVMEGPGQTHEILPRGRSIKEVFYEANGLLLILGEPGAGKTTTLLQLARDLIAEVDDAFTQPVPVILNLSTWTNKQQPLDVWLFAELTNKYRLPKKDAKQWLEERRILPLLDGLDEVKAENRAACVERLNHLVNDYGLQGLVVCSRIKDYTDLNVRLAFYRAIYIQPLTPEQIDEYLKRAGEKLASLSSALHIDEALRSLARSPLILNIMTLAYQDAPADDLSNPVLSTDEARRKHLFDAYITRMFQRKTGTRQYDDEQTKSRLSWLARNMQRHNQEVFLIEGLQPTWLSSGRWHWFYFLTSRLPGVLVITLFFLSIELYSLISDYFRVVYPDVLFARVWYVVKATIAGLVIALSIGFFAILRYEWMHKQKRKVKFPPILWTVMNISIIWLVSGLIIGSVIDWSAGFLYGLIFGVLFGLRDNRYNPEIDIQTVEALNWSWRKALIGGLIGIVVGCTFGVLVLSSSSMRFSFGDLLSWMGFFSELFGPLGAVLSGLRRGIVETKSIPNQGIRLSIRNAMLGGLALGLTGWIMNVFGLTIGPSIFGLIGVLWYGGLDVIQHYILRLLLVIQGYTPRDYVHFLDYAVDRIFLQKVGGGYRFIHRLLLEHFADMYEKRA
jgi:eukaryotic-like serine/threonine-protein kinase